MASALVSSRKPQLFTGGSGRRWWVLGVVGLAQLMIALDITIVNVALPAAQKSLAFSDGSRQWVITAYALAFGSLLLLGGRLADLFGRRTTLLIGLVVFGLGSALGGAAPSFTLLIAARVIQGIGGALLAPAALATVTATFLDERERARAFSIFGAIVVAGGAIGLLLGGVLTEQLGWRWTLYVNVGLSVLAVVGVVVLIGRDAPVVRPRLDVAGTILVSVGLFGMVYGFSQAQSNGWTSPSTFAVLLGSLVLLSAFIWWQSRAHSPLLPLRILLDRDRGASFVAMAIGSLGFFAVFLFFTFYLQLTLGYSPVATGLAFLPILVGLIVSSLIGMSLIKPIIGPKVMVPAGMLLAAAALAWLTDLDGHSTYSSAILAPLLLFGVGLGLVYPTAMDMGTAHLGECDDGIAGATVNTTQQIGGSVGIALLSTAAVTAGNNYIKHHYPPDAAALTQAALHSYAVVYSSAALAFTLGAIVVAVLYRRRPTRIGSAGRSTAAPPARHAAPAVVRPPICSAATQPTRRPLPYPQETLIPSSTSDSSEPLRM